MDFQLPLEELWIRLEAKRIPISTYERIEAIRVMQLLGNDGRFANTERYFDNEKAKNELKVSLCAVIAKTPEEQKTFYAIFEEFWNQKYGSVKKWPPEGPEIKNYLKLLSIAAILLIFIGFFAFFYLNSPPSTQIIWSQKQYYQDQNIDMVLRTKSKTNFVKPKKVIWFFNGKRIDSLNNKISILPKFDSIQNLKVRAEIVYDNWWKSKATVEDSMQILSKCDLNYSKIIIANSANSYRIDQEINFEAVYNNESNNNYAIRWDMGDGTIIQNNQKVSHSYKNGGKYNVRFYLTTESCNYKDSITVAVNSIKKIPSIPVSYYKYESISENAGFEWNSFFKELFNYYELIFLALLSYGLLILLPKLFGEFIKRKHGIYEKPEALPLYFGFSNQNQSINIKEAQYQWADILRHRQKSERSILDIDKSIKSTIKSGSFPQLSYRNFSKESEHLILIDEKNAHNQQTNLFDFLTKWIKEQDVHVVVFFFLEDPRVCWNADHPSGISIEKLAITYINYRLLVISDGENLIDLNTKEVKPWVRKSLQDWEYRVLFTPVWATYWNYQEAILNKFFTLLPATPEGKLWINQDLEASSKPSFTSIRNRFTKDEIQPDRGLFGVEDEVIMPDLIRKWLGESIDNSDVPPSDGLLYYWALATVLYQLPSWEMTIAIGRAIEEKTTQKENLVTTINLLKITTMPWLQKKTISNETKKALLVELKKAQTQIGLDIEAIARREILAMLEKNQPPENTFAYQEWRRQKGIQWLGISPQDYEESQQRKKAISFLQTLNDAEKIKDIELKQEIEEINKQEVIDEGEWIKTKKIYSYIVPLYFFVIFLPIIFRQLIISDEIAANYKSVFVATDFDSTAIYNNKAVSFFNKNILTDNSVKISFDSLKRQNYYFNKAFKYNLSSEQSVKGKKDIIYKNYLRMVSNLSVNLYYSKRYNEVINQDLFAFIPPAPNKAMEDALRKYKLFVISLKAICYYQLGDESNSKRLLSNFNDKKVLNIANVETQKNVQILKLIQDNQFDAIGNFVKGTAWIKKGQYYGYIDESFKQIFAVDKYKFEEANDFQSNGLAVIKQNGKYSLLKKEKGIIGGQFDEIRPFFSGLARIKAGGNYGFIRESAQLAYPPYLNYADDFKDNFAYVELAGRPSYINGVEEIDQIAQMEKSNVKTIKIFRIESLQTLQQLYNEPKSDSRQKADAILDISWRSSLSNELVKPYFNTLSDFVVDEYSKQNIHPSSENLFRAFNLCPLDKVRVVIIGPEPYNDENQADGLAFSVNPGVEIPPTLQDIYSEIEEEFKQSRKGMDGDLTYLADQGVLLLNSVLTVRNRQANSHKGKGWEQFTDAVINQIATQKQGVVFLLWGKIGTSKGINIDRNRHLVLEADDPSPTASNFRVWFGNNNFTDANKYLIKKGEKPIKWLPDARATLD